MSRIKTFINDIQYRIAYKKMKSLPDKVQQAIGRDMYECIYDTYKGQTGKHRGRSTVTFECPYPAHVEHHVMRRLRERIADQTDITYDYHLTAEENDMYTLSVDVATNDEYPCLAADASAMSAILQLPIVGGDFSRYSTELN